jgi:RNA polymerase sigma factor (sigma-70 family)
MTESKNCSAYAELEDELLLVTAINYLIDHGEKKFRALIADVKSNSPSKGIVCAEVVHDDSLFKRAPTGRAALNTGESNTQYIHNIASDEPSPIDCALTQSSVDVINKLVDELPKEEREVIRRRFGLRNYESLFLKHVAPLLNVSQERARQIELSALNRLRIRMRRIGLTMDSLDCF